VKAKRGARYGDPLEMIGAEKLRRLTSAAEAWLAAHAGCRHLDVSFEAVAVQDGRLRRVGLVL
jgi:Holliday junction resolvase-like predicted endonuclease